MTSGDKKRLLKEFGEDKELAKLMLELEVITKENKWWTYTKVLVPTVLMTVASMVAGIHLAKLILTQ